MIQQDVPFALCFDKSSGSLCHQQNTRQCDQCVCFLFIFHVRIHNNAMQCLTLYHSLSSSSQIHGNTFSYFGVCIFVKLRQYIAIYWRHRCLNRRQCNLLAEAQNRKYGATPELIFVTNVTNYICGEKIVVWRNFGKFWEILPQFTRFHVEKN